MPSTWLPRENRWTVGGKGSTQGGSIQGRFFRVIKKMWCMEMGSVVVVICSYTPKNFTGTVRVLKGLWRSVGCAALSERAKPLFNNSSKQDDPMYFSPIQKLTPFSLE